MQQPKNGLINLINNQSNRSDNDAPQDQCCFVVFMSFSGGLGLNTILFQKYFKYTCIIDIQQIDQDLIVSSWLIYIISWIYHLLAVDLGVSSVVGGSATDFWVPEIVSCGSAGLGAGSWFILGVCWILLTVG